MVIRSLTVFPALAALLACDPFPTQAEDTVQLRPFHTGVCQIGQDHVFGPPHTSDQRIPFVIYSFLVEGKDDQKALIDLGPKTLDYSNRMFLQHGFFRDLGPGAPRRFPDHITQPMGNVFVQLDALNMQPNDIQHIIFSHLHADHHGMDDATNGGAAELFSNALLHLSARGWKNNLDARRDGRWNSYVDYAFSDFLLRADTDGRLRPADDATIMPGVHTLYLGGHSVCSQATLVDTPSGLAIIASDDIYHYKLLEENILPQIRTSPKNYRQAIDRLVDLAVKKKGVIIPMHDPVVWQAWQETGTNWIETLRPRSDQAIRRYKQARRIKAQAGSDRHEGRFPG